MALGHEQAGLHVTDDINKHSVVTQDTIMKNFSREWIKQI